MIQNNYFTDNADLLSFYNQCVDWPRVVDAYEMGFQDAALYAKSGDEKLSMAPSNLEEALDYYRAIMESGGELSGKILAARAQKMDHTGLKYDNGKVIFPVEMEEAFVAFKEAGLVGYSSRRGHGGLGLPAVVQCFLMEMVARADASFSITLGCFALAETIERFASKEMVETYVPQMASGDLSGAMALTEPNYGSDLPNIKTRAFRDEKGNWKISGTKRFITHACGFGDRPSVILTLARTGEPGGGARGLSFFLVRTQDIHVAKIEHKMGLHCSPTCEVVYDNSPALIIGEEGKGLVKYAMGMMNTARLSIAAQALGIAVASQEEALKYAREREQFGKVIQEIPAVRKMLDYGNREIYAMRSLLQEASLAVDMYLWRMEHLADEGLDEKTIRKDESVRRWDKIASFYTPLAKYYISEICNRVAYNAIQIHGGSGYTEEYDVARLYRDARITTIYEGTTQLQIVAAIGGVVSGMSQAGFLREYIDEVLAGFSASTELKEMYEEFNEIVDLYREMSGAERETFSFEVVETAARFLCGLLMERNTARLEDAALRSRAGEWTLLYHLDSVSILAGHRAVFRRRVPQAVA
ncbi:MAG: acyl-CoA dehydrogenase family protein [Spirochaetales bacterium]|nr:acyl-CoA dehydrogenase family protein [Spirochaetales bacterium]